jgi:hypothetical protein
VLTRRRLDNIASSQACNPRILPEIGAAGVVHLGNSSLRFAAHRGSLKPQAVDVAVEDISAEEAIAPSCLQTQITRVSLVSYNYSIANSLKLANQRRRAPNFQTNNLGDSQRATFTSIVSQDKDLLKEKESVASTLCTGQESDHLSTTHHHCFRSPEKKK